MVIVMDSDMHPSIELLHAVLANYTTVPRYRVVDWPPIVYTWGETATDVFRRVPAEIVLPKMLYQELGGWDEDFAGNWGWDDVLFGHCAIAFVRHRGNGSTVTGNQFVLHEARIPGKSPENVLRDKVAPFERVVSKNKPVYIDKWRSGQLCNRGPVMRVPWGVVLKQG